MIPNDISFDYIMSRRNNKILIIFNLEENKDVIDQSYSM